MSTLTGRQISDTYKQLVKLAVSANAGVSADLTQIQTGDGTNIAFQVATGAVKATGTFGVDGNASVSGNVQIGGTVSIDGANVAVAGPGSTDVLTCDYGQGKMTEETMFELLEKIKKKFGDIIIGVDSCGEPTCGFSGAGFKAHPEELGTPGYIRKMKPLIAPHNKINDRLCELFYKK